MEHLPRMQYVAAQRKSQKLLYRETPENFTGRILFMSMFIDISFGTRDNEQKCLENARLVSLYARRFFVNDNGHLLVLVLRKSGTLSKRTVHKESGTIWLKGCCWNSQKADVQLSVLRRQLKSKGHGKLSIHYCADQATIETVFRIIVSANQPSLYGAVAEMCEEYESLYERTWRPDVVMGQSIALSEIKAEVPLENDDPAYQNFVLQQYEDRIEKLSQQEKLRTFCMDAGFLSGEWTVFHDERHWRFDTFQYSGLS